LLNNFSNRSYYILIPFTIKAAKERCLNIVNTKGNAKDIELVNTVSKDYNKNKYNNNKCDNNISLDNRLLLNNNPLSNNNLSSSELLLNNKRLLDNNASFNNNDLFVQLLNNHNLSDNKLSFNNNDNNNPLSNIKPIFKGDKLITDKDKEGYKREEDKNNTNVDLQDFTEQHKLLNCFKDLSNLNICPKDKSIKGPVFNLDKSAG
jgi:hypothetical protein